MQRWYREKWVDLNRPIKNSRGKVKGYEACGRSKVKGDKTKYPLCRPTNKVSPKTPRTYREIGKNAIRKAKTQKARVKESGNIKFGGGVVKVPENVKRWAVYAFKLKRIGFGGGDWHHAKQLATREYISNSDLRDISKWFDQHIVESYPQFREWQKAGRPKDKSWHDAQAITTWISWGGNAAFNWVVSERQKNDK